MGTGVGYTGVLPSYRARKVLPSEAGPGSPAGAGVGGVGPGRVFLGRWAGTVLHPPFGPGRSPAGPSLVQDLADCPPTANKGEIYLILLKS